MHGAKEIKISGQELTVNADIEVIHSMSAHGDMNDLCRYLACQETDSVSTVYLVHGEYNVQQDFRVKLVQKGYAQILIPEIQAVYGLHDALPEVADT